MFDVYHYITGTGCLDIQYKEKQDTKYMGKKVKGKMCWQFENNSPMQLSISIYGKKLCIIKKDMNDVKIYDSQEIFKFRIVGGYNDFYVTLIEVLDKFGYKESDMRFRAYESVKKSRLAFWEGYADDEDFSIYRDFSRYEIGGGLLE